jgi:excisionase family DNA binding protein
MLMKFEKSDIQLLAKELLRELMPTLKTSEKTSANDFIFDVKQLSKYLNVPDSWIYRQTCDHNIPYYKLGGYLRFKKPEIDKWLEEQKVNPLPKH